VGLLLPKLSKAQEQPLELREAVRGRGERERTLTAKKLKPLLEIAQPSERLEVQASLIAKVDLVAEVVAS
jgi:hypothetical protein